MIGFCSGILGNAAGVTRGWKPQASRANALGL